MKSLSPPLSSLTLPFSLVFFFFFFFWVCVCVCVCELKLDVAQNNVTVKVGLIAQDSGTVSELHI